MKTRIAVFASGSGTNARALLEKAKTLSNIEIVFGICDQEHAGILQEKIFQFAPMLSKKKWEESILDKICEQKIDWILLAGFMRILSPWFLSEVRALHGGKNQVLNIHPSLLPKYKGLDGYKKAFENGDAELGASIHFVVPEVDAGEILMQRKFLLEAGEKLEDVIRKGKQLENQMYAEVLEEISAGKIGAKDHVASY